MRPTVGRPEALAKGIDLGLKVMLSDCESERVRLHASATSVQPKGGTGTQLTLMAMYSAIHPLPVLILRGASTIPITSTCKA